MLRGKAVNYNQVNNIEFSIKKLDMAFNADKVKKKRKKKPKSTAAERISDTSAFYKIDRNIFYINKKYYICNKLK